MQSAPGGRPARTARCRQRLSAARRRSANCGTGSLQGSARDEGPQGGPANRRLVDGYACVLQFDTPGADFVRGVEVGRVWEALKHDPGPVEEIVHASNAEMILRIAEATARSVSSEELDETWLRVTFGAA